MTFFPEFNRIYPSEPPRDPEVRINPIEPEKKEKEPFKNLFNTDHSEEEVSMIGALNSLLGKLSAVVERHKHLSHASLPSSLLYALLDLKYLFDKLPSLPEEGFNELYTHLASVWLYIDQELRFLHKTKWEHEASYQTLMQLLAEIGGHQASGSEALSYYLLRHKKEDICPLPLIKLFSELKNQKETLSQWCEQIEQITH